jgi:hypothetical protein
MRINGVLPIHSSKLAGFDVAMDVILLALRLQRTLELGNDLEYP